MLNIPTEKQSLDLKCQKLFDLTPEVLVENAARSLRDFIIGLGVREKIVIVCGSGGNGADGYALARMLANDYDVGIYSAKQAKHPLCILQFKRAKKLGLNFLNTIPSCDIVVDCLIGTGFIGELDSQSLSCIQEMQDRGKIKIACDVPSGLKRDGSASLGALKADYTLAMGAIHLGLLSDESKDFIGQLHVGFLGIPNQRYCEDSHIKLLEETDLQLPTRGIENAHKGNFGHVAVFEGDFIGASNLAGLAALKVGCGSVSVIGKQPLHAELMYTPDLPKNFSVFGAGFGINFSDSKERNSTQSLKRLLAVLDSLNKHTPILLDASILRHHEIPHILQKFQYSILTPHPGEFLPLYNHSMDSKIQSKDLLANPIQYLLEFTKCYKNCVVILKGANVKIAKDGKVFINNLGNVSLAKAGSGDILSGIILGLLAQNLSNPSLLRSNSYWEQDPLLYSAIQGTLMHSLSARIKQNYALMPTDLIRNLGNLG